jgi:hypothetical protein
MDLIRANLELPVLENERDAGRKNATTETARATIAEALLARTSYFSILLSL